MIWGYHYFRKHPYVVKLMCFGDTEFPKHFQTVKDSWSILIYVEPSKSRSQKTCVFFPPTHPLHGHVSDCKRDMERWSNNTIATSQRQAELAALIAAFQSERWAPWMFGNWRFSDRKHPLKTNCVKTFQIIKLVKHPWKHWWKVTWMEICVALVDSLQRCTRHISLQACC